MGNSVKYVYLWGGLGNVLYQLNFAYYLSQLNYKVSVKTGLLRYSNWLLREIVKIHEGVEDGINYFIDDKKIKVDSCLSVLDIFYLFSYKVGLNVSGFKFFDHSWPNNSEIFKYNYYLGYFQRTRWISRDIGQTFEKKFRSSIDSDLIELIKLDTTAVIHVRLGDKFGSGEFDLKYEKVLPLLKEYKVIVMVTDDVTKAKSIISLKSLNKKVYFINSTNLLDDFYILFSSSVTLISRSSFSWWATEISDFNQKIYQPQPMYTHLDWEHFSMKIRIGYIS